MSNKLSLQLFEHDAQFGGCEFAGLVGCVRPLGNLCLLDRRQGSGRNEPREFSPDPLLVSVPPPPGGIGAPLPARQPHLQQLNPQRLLKLSVSGPTPADTSIKDFQLILNKA